MTIITNEEQFTLESQPFAEAAPGGEAEQTESPTSEGATSESLASFSPWAEGLTPFSEAGSPAGEQEALLESAFEAVRDEAFDEAVSELLAETEDAVGQRFSDESPATAGERERLAAAHLAPTQYAAEQYLERLSEALVGQDVESLSDEQLDELMDRVQPELSEVSPAGEQFIGGLIRKARSAVRFVANAAKKVGAAAGGLLTAGLKGLTKLVRPLLKRVLSFAIGRLPAPLRAPARLLSSKLFGESEGFAETSAETEAFEAEREGEAFAISPAVSRDTEALTESFDAALAEALVSGETGEVGFAGEGEAEAEGESEAAQGSSELELLAEARGRLIDALAEARSADEVAPAVEQFIPALLGALRIGINLVGRPRVVGFLAKFLGKLIGKWVGPQLSGPLSNAIVDTGLRLISLEQLEPELESEAVPAMLAGTIEDTVRQLAEASEYELEDESLMRAATARAFDRSVAATFPPSLLRSGVQRGAQLGGRFVTRKARSPRPYRRYSRSIDVEVTAGIADAIDTFGGVSLGSSLRAAGLTLPARVRIHLFQATIGTSLRRIAAIERTRSGVRLSSSQLHPLTPRAAGLLLKDPGMGVAVPAEFLRSRARVAAGQRFYWLEPLDQTLLPTVGGPGKRSGGEPSQGWVVVDTRASVIRVGLFFSEAETQTIAAAIREGRSEAVLLPALTKAYDGLARRFAQRTGRLRIRAELEQSEAVSRLPRVLDRIPPGAVAGLTVALRRWLLPAFAMWSREGSAEFARASADPRNGVTVTATIRSAPGLDLVRQAASGALSAASLAALASGRAFRGAPAIAVTAHPGRRRP
ncbi:hypothetical protein SAMN04515691_3052 [Leifsonia sp. 98AMF]|uniref:hypothetical protein n=1 Tax=unclassified Leifsonia TaxID=2663824 RepID=UPI0008793053|nr:MULTISPECIES: hypothetical protein [unclassified Leifsonia]SDJ23661.1 hypothetical protein SAMN04515684_2818 [Leifsonia sp. 466MF]SDK59794.1 hypothetical protein SAMN04515683_3946 [Leifsonia sp. 157MF]SEN65618.1 hypothetical protein SAMN04515685_3927 [Leifsonia sp. 467MF]SFM59340.1 hypothetical protein SAMN04515691_3052 [Leifsonia sp. 98AMF]